MLVAISGSQSSGKTTLISALPYGSIDRKTSRSILKDWNVTLSDVNNNHQLTVNFQDEALSRKMADEADAVRSNSVIVTERTYADLFTYALVALGKDNEYSDWLDDYYVRCAQAQLTYTHVFYLQAGHFPVVGDGVRGTNQHYSQMVDGAMLHNTTQMTKKFTLITTPNINSRVDQVVNTIRYDVVLAQLANPSIDSFTLSNAPNNTHK